MSNNSVSALRNLFHAWALIMFPVDTNLDSLRFECISPSVHAPRLRVINFYVDKQKIFACKTEQLENATLGKFWVSFFFQRYPEDKLMTLEEVRESLKSSLLL